MEKNNIKIQIITLGGAVELEMEPGDYHNIMKGNNPNPYLQIKIVDLSTIQLIVNPYKFPNYQGGKEDEELPS